jgi:hypothetical protein
LPDINKKPCRIDLELSGISSENPLKAEVQLRRIYYQKGKRCMLVSLKSMSDLSRGCALPMIARRILVTHPHHPAIRE